MTNKPFHNNYDDLINELHSRPFMSIEAGSRVSYLVIAHSPDAALEDNLTDLRALAESLGVAIPSTARNYFWHDFGDFILKWERHTEFAAYMISERNPDGGLFAKESFTRFPDAWIAKHNDNILTSAIIEITKPEGDYVTSIEQYRELFADDSLAAAEVLEGAAVIASDFQIDANGHLRFLIIPGLDIGRRRLGRVSQRLLEIETYMIASMLGLPVARGIARRLPEFEKEFLPIIAGISSNKSDADESLQSLLAMAAEVEQILSETSFRFGATEAYADLVDQRVSVLRERRLAGFQLFSEFMMRRYEPGMRTVNSTWTRLTQFSERLERAATFLRTKVEVSNSDGQRELLASMNKRAEAQLRLQETVEGLSVVAISYYAVSLVGYLLAPFAYEWKIDKTWLMAIAVLPVVFLVWVFIHGIKKHVVKESEPH